MGRPPHTVLTALSGRWPLSGASFASMFFLGVALAVVGATAKDIGLAPATVGWLIAAKHFGFFWAVLISGNLADSRSKTRLLLVGSLILSAAFACFYARPELWINLLVIVAVGAGAGVYEGVTDALLLDVHSRNRSRYINVNHFFITLGMTAIALYLIFLRLDWRAALLQAAALVAVLAAFYGLAALPPAPAPRRGLLAALRAIAHKRLLGLLFGVTVLAVGIELGTVGLLTSFLADLRGLSATMAKLGLVIFLTGMFSGRLLLGLFVPGRQIRRYLAWALAACVVAFGILYLVRLGPLTLPWVFVCGLAISAVTPMTFALAGTCWRESTATVMACVKAAVPCGGMLLPLLIGVLSSAWSFQAALLVFPLAGLAGLVLLLFVRISEPAC